MDELYIPLLLLNLTKQEEQLLIMLFLMHKNSDMNTPKKYTIEELGKLSGHERIGAEDLLNKLMIRNIIGRITYGGVIKDAVKENFDEAITNENLLNQQNILQDFILMMLIQCMY